MVTSTLRKHILEILASSSSQSPVDLTNIHSKIAPKIKLADLTTTIDLMCQDRELQTCSGIKGGKAYVCYWISGNLPPAWGRPAKVKVAAKKPEKVAS